MYFIFEIEFSNPKNYIKNLIISYAKVSKIECKVMQSNKKIYIVLNKEQPNLDKFLLGLESILPASIYMGASKHYFSNELPQIKEIKEVNLPLNISLCPNCQKEMFDISSNRYYYPFTSCNSCGSQHPFINGYPFSKNNSSFKYIMPCPTCQEELKSNPFRKDYPLISCLNCSISLRMFDNKSERFANDKGSFKQLFEVAAKAINKDKTILVKTLNGYRKFFKLTKDNYIENSYLLITNANSLNTHLMLVPQEFNALLSIERPILRVSTKSNELKEIFGSSALVKYADDAITMLLSRELLNLGLEYVGYIECDEFEEANYIVDFDLPTTFNKDFRLFINQDTKYIISGQRSIFPMTAKNPKKVVVIANNLAAVEVDNTTIIDNIENFDKVETKEIRILQNQEYNIEFKNIKRFKAREASILSVVAQHNIFNQNAIGVYFEENLYFTYYNGVKVVDVITPVAFENINLWDKISSLREGSDRLVKNFKAKYPKIWQELNNTNENLDIFKVAATILELKEPSLEAISAKALEFYGKGGVAIDTKLKDNRFDNYAFIASIISYKIAGVESSMLSYSIYESFGEYIADIVSQLVTSLKTRTVILSGIAFANQALFSTLNKKIGIYKPLMNKNLPINKENCVYGALYL